MTTWQDKDCILVKPLWKSAWRSLKKTKIELPCGPNMPLLCIYPKGSKHLCNTLIPVLIMALFTIITLWEEPRCLSTDEDKENMVSYKNEWNYIICMKINGNGNHHIKQNKSTLNIFHVFPLYERFRRKTMKVKEEQKRKNAVEYSFTLWLL